MSAIKSFCESRKATLSADLGGSSSYSFQKNESRRGEGFRVNIICTRGRRS
jgi:hypothetical protein